MAQAIPLNIVFEDDHLLVVNKPGGMVVHPAPGHLKSGTLVNALLHHWEQPPIVVETPFAGCLAILSRMHYMTMKRATWDSVLLTWAKFKRLVEAPQSLLVSLSDSVAV